MIVKRWVFIYISLTTIILLLTVVGCSIAGQPISSGAGGPANPIAVTVELSKYPKLYEPVDVAVTTKVHRPVSGPVEVWLAVPPTAAFINGQMWWRGNLTEGESHQFRATIAFVAEGTSSVSAQAKFPASPDKIHSTDRVVDAEGVRVTRSGGELSSTRSSPPTPQQISGPSNLWLDPNQSYRSSETPLDGSTLLNESDQPRLFIVRDRSGFEELQREGLVPATPWGYWNGQGYNFTGVLDRDFKDIGVFVALYDRRRSTTGYHFAFLRPQVEAPKVVPVGTPDPTEPRRVFLNILSTKPRADWPVEERAVSPYQIRLLSYLDQDRPTELIIQVNGKEVSRYVVDPQATSPLFEELTLSSFKEMELP